jgi:hypothetical protein
VIPEHSHRLRQLLSGDLDFVEQLDRDDVRQMADSTTARTIAYWHRQYTYLVWNACREPF